MEGASAWFMCGLIWFVQVVHYPAFCGVGADAFVGYHARHTRATTAVVLGPMVLELASAIGLTLVRPAWVGPGIAWGGLAMLAVIWVSTLFLQVPQHRLLAAGFDDASHRTLCRSNWLRTIGWTARAVLLTIAAGAALQSR
jgi:hypothetical protein